MSHFFNLKAIELKLYRDVRADEPQFLTKFDHYPIIRTEVRQSSVRVGDAAETSWTRATRWSRGHFFNPADRADILQAALALTRRTF